MKRRKFFDDMSVEEIREYMDGRGELPSKKDSRKVATYIVATIIAGIAAIAVFGYVILNIL